MKRAYFLRPKGARGPIKIGCSQLPEKRLRDMMLWSPIDLEFVASIPGGHALERELHERFASNRLHAEWFDATDELVAYIEQARWKGWASGTDPTPIPPRSDPVLPEIERFLVAAGVPASRFGLDVLGDPNLVRQLRDGSRSLTARTAAKVREFIQQHSRRAAA